MRKASVNRKTTAGGAPPRRTRQRFPPGWNEEKVGQVIAHYDNQTEAEQLAEIEAAATDPSQTMMSVPTELVPTIAKLIARHQGKGRRCRR
jgi:hypothetical protein